MRTVPRRWTREDTVLVVDSMMITLQQNDGLNERTQLAIAETYGEEVLAFLRPPVLERTAALDGSFVLAPPVPSAEKMKPHTASPEVTSTSAAATEEDAFPSSLLAASFGRPSGDIVLGSNSFALGGSRVAGGGALVANDMHLPLAVPNIWYRASLTVAGRTVTGVTLPGVFGIIVGSNGDVAWGFTNSQIDTSDVVIVEPDPADPTRYRVPDGDGWEKFEVVRETISVARRAPETMEIILTRWGPLLTKRDTGGRMLALHWVAYDPKAINLHLSDMMEAHSVDEAIAVAHGTAIPAQNLLVGDRFGHVAWTIIGRVPRRLGFDGLFPESWADGSRRWNGFLSPAEVPVVRDPPSGQIWTANNRVLGGEAFALLGNGDYDDPARATQIRDRLTILTGRAVVPNDLLAVQLDDESLFLRRWRDLLLRTLTEKAVRDSPTLAELRNIVKEWHGHAAIDEAGHRVVREFRRIVAEMVLNPIYEPVRQREPSLHISRTKFLSEQPLWSILTARPAYLLPSSVSPWDALLLRAANLTAEMAGREPAGLALRNCTWGRVNTLKMHHPLSGALPSWLGRWLDMPAQALPGDSNMPRVQTPDFGASMRMVVSPGREREGIFHQPGGASGNPLSPFYRAGHDDWAAGRATPFLPGEKKHRLALHPFKS